MRYSIADIIVDMDIKYPRLANQSKKYIYDGDRDTNIKIRFPDDAYEKQQAVVPQLGLGDIEYLVMGSEFYSTLIKFGGMLLHASCVVYENKAYLFSAPCGTGKSTHTQLWLKRFPGAYILNDDKPAIRITKTGVYAYGTPFSGKNDISVNTGVPIGGICVLDRDTTNHIERMNVDDALFHILNQTIRPQHEEDMDILLKILDIILREVPVFNLHCNMDLEAAETAYNMMSKEQEDNK